jgi:glycosyltransferase involved in cell wall biosynthesis
MHMDAELPTNRELWLLDDGRTFGGGQVIALRLGQFIGSEAPSWSVRVFCPTTSELGKRCLAAGIPVSDAQFPDLSASGALAIARAVRALRDHLGNAGESVIVVAGSLRAQVYAHTAAAGVANKPAMVQFMTEQDSAHRASGARLLRRFGAVVALGGNAARAYGDALPAVDVIKVNNFLLPAELTGPLARRGEPSRPPVLGVLARLIPEKGVLELIEELASVRSVWAKLLVGGNTDDTAYARRIEERIVALGLEGSISILGHVSDVRAFLGEVDVLLVPSIGNEGQPTVILEALASDRPAIVRRHVWSDDFEGLPVFPYGDASDLAGLLKDLPRLPVDPEKLRRRFGPMQVLTAFETAAGQSRTKRRR